MVDVAEKARIGRDLFFRSEDHRLAAKPRICSDAPDTALPPFALAFGLGMGETANGALACCKLGFRQQLPCLPFAIAFPFRVMP